MRRSLPGSAWDEDDSETREKLGSGDYPAGVVIVTEFEHQTYWGWGCPRCGEHDYVGRSPRDRVAERYRRHREQCSADAASDGEGGEPG